MAAARSDTRPAVASPRSPDYEQLFLLHLPTIHRLAADLARQHRLTRDETEAFVSDVQFRILSDNYAVLRKFRRQSALRTYLASVIKRMYLDYRIAAWGKWRPSARSRRAGDTAVLFERLTIRDGLTFDEACVMLETNHGRKVDIDALERTFAALRPASRPRFVSDADLFGEPGAEPRGDAIAAAAEHHEIVDETTRILAAALAALDPTDRDVLTLRFRDGASLAAIARRLKIDQKSSYRRLKRVLRRLRESLEAAGLSRAAVMSALERSDAGIGRVFAGDRPERSAASVETCLVA